MTPCAEFPIGKCRDKQTTRRLESAVDISIFTGPPESLVACRDYPNVPGDTI